MRDEKGAKRVDAQSVEGKQAEENRERDWGVALREIWKEWEENGEQQQKIKGLETVATERVSEK